MRPSSRRHRAGRLVAAGAAAALLWIGCVGEGEDGGGARASGKPARSHPDPAIWEEPRSEVGLERGRQVWTGTCIRCHSTGLAGAPLIGNRALWAPRIAKGVEVLVEHAMDGFMGPAGGEMPARGGNPDLTDEEVRAAVEFMVTSSR